MTAARVTTLSYLLAGRFHRLACRCYGAPDAPPLVCVHGLTRNAHDFDVLAQALSDRFHVVSPDLPGRGGSDWLADPMLYTTATYVTALSHLFASLDGPIDYLGTSLGGICAMEIAAMAGQPIRRLALNDVGPFVPRDALLRIRDYLCAPAPRFADREALRLYLRRVHAPFGPLTEAQWRVIAHNSARPLDNGDVALHYDPQISIPYAMNPIEDLNMWDWWNAINVPTLVIRGESSDVLSADTLNTMAQRAQTLTIPNTGHAPALQDAPTIKAVRDFLLE